MAIVSNWVKGLPATNTDLKNSTVEGVSEDGKNEKVIPLEELKQAKQSGFEVPNDGRAPSF